MAAAIAHAPSVLGDTMKLDKGLDGGGPGYEDGNAAMAQNDGEKDPKLFNGQPEAQYVLQVLDACAQKLHVISVLTPALLKDKIIDAVDHELIVALKEHFQIGKENMHMLEHWKRTQRAEGYDPLSDEMKEEAKIVEELDLCLLDSTRTVARLLQQNSIVVRRLREIKGKRPTSSLDFMNTFARLRKLMHHKLKMTAEEERAMTDQLRDLRVREKEDTRKFLELTERLKEERNEHTQTISTKDHKIHRLHRQIEDLVKRTKRNRQAFDQKMKLEETMARDEYKNTEATLQKQTASVEKKLDDIMTENSTTFALLHRQLFHKSEHVHDKIKVYDTDMKEKHDQLTELQRVYDDEASELAKLREYFAVVDAENQRLYDETMEIRARRDRELVLERQQHYSACMIQKLFKAFFVRETKRKKREAKAATEGNEKK
jgi:hypothetical protein